MLLFFISCVFVLKSIAQESSPWEWVILFSIYYLLCFQFVVLSLGLLFSVCLFYLFVFYVFYVIYDLLYFLGILLNLFLCLFGCSFFIVLQKIRLLSLFPQYTMYFSDMLNFHFYHITFHFDFSSKVFHKTFFIVLICIWSASMCSWATFIIFCDNILIFLLFYLSFLSLAFFLLSQELLLMKIVFKVIIKNLLHRVFFLTPLFLFLIW